MFKDFVRDTAWLNSFRQAVAVSQTENPGVLVAGVSSCGSNSLVSLFRGGERSVFPPCPPLKFSSKFSLPRRKAIVQSEFGEKFTGRGKDSFFRLFWQHYGLVLRNELSELLRKEAQRKGEAIVFSSDVISVLEPKIKEIMLSNFTDVLSDVYPDESMSYILQVYTAGFCCVDVQTVAATMKGHKSSTGQVFDCVIMEKARKDREKIEIEMVLPMAISQIHKNSVVEVEGEGNLSERDNKGHASSDLPLLGKSVSTVVLPQTTKFARKFCSQQRTQMVQQSIREKFTDKLQAKFFRLFWFDYGSVLRNKLPELLQQQTEASKETIIPQDIFYILQSKIKGVMLGNFTDILYAVYPNESMFYILRVYIAGFCHGNLQGVSTSLQQYESITDHAFDDFIMKRARKERESWESEIILPAAVAKMDSCLAVKKKRERWEEACCSRAKSTTGHSHNYFSYFSCAVVAGFGVGIPFVIFNRYLRQRKLLYVEKNRLIKELEIIAHKFGKGRGSYDYSCIVKQLGINRDGTMPVSAPIVFPVQEALSKLLGTNFSEIIKAAQRELQYFQRNYAKAKEHEFLLYVQKVYQYLRQLRCDLRVSSELLDEINIFIVQHNSDKTRSDRDRLNFFIIAECCYVSWKILIRQLHILRDIQFWDGSIAAVALTVPESIQEKMTDSDKRNMIRYQSLLGELNAINMQASNFFESLCSIEYDQLHTMKRDFDELRKLVQNLAQLKKQFRILHKQMLQEYVIICRRFTEKMENLREFMQNEVEFSQIVSQLPVNVRCVDVAVYSDFNEWIKKINSYFVSVVVIRDVYRNSMFLRFCKDDDVQQHPQLDLASTSTAAARRRGPSAVRQLTPISIASAVLGIFRHNQSCHSVATAEQVPTTQKL